MARVIHLEIDQSTTFERSFQALDSSGTAIDLTNYTVKAQAKPTYTSFVAHTFTATVTDALNGRFTLSLTDIETRDLPPGRMLYDIKITSTITGNVLRIIEGIVQVNPAITDANPFIALQGTKIVDPRIVHVHDNKEVLDQIVTIGQVGTKWKRISVDHTVANGDRLFVDATSGDIVLYVDPMSSPEVVEDNFTFTVADIGNTFSGTNRVIIRSTDETSPRIDLFIIEGPGVVQFVYLLGYGWKISLAVPFATIVT